MIDQHEATEGNSVQEENSTESQPRADESSSRQIMRVFLFFGGLMCIGCCVLFWPKVWGAREAARRATCKNNLKQIAIALQNYHEVWDSFPPAYSTDANGKPLHSWRVLILPYVDSNPYYNQLKLSEPWDSPHNREVLDIRMPIYRCPSDSSDGKQTSSYLAIVGPETAWPAPDSCKLDDIKDGTAYTFLVVEVANSGIHWAEPRDLHVMQMSPNVNPKAGMGLSSGHSGGMYAIFGDGQVRFIPDKTTPKTLRALLTRTGGEEIADDL